MVLSLRNAPFSILVAAFTRVQLEVFPYLYCNADDLKHSSSFAFCTLVLTAIGVFCSVVIYILLCISTVYVLQDVQDY